VLKDIPKIMRGRNGRPGAEAVKPGERRFAVLLSERKSEFDPRLARENRSPALPFDALVRKTVKRSQATIIPDTKSRAPCVRQPRLTAKTWLGPPEASGIDPLYLFMCGLAWRSQSNNSAGWELVRCLRLPGQTARIAATLLTGTDKKYPVAAWETGLRDGRFRKNYAG
jgi:hypothetical protein